MGLNGVDIASYQKDMRCDKVDADFIIIKATQGCNYKNPDFARQAALTVDSGKLLGAYHYSTGFDPAAEADYFISKLGPYIGKAILCLDWEHNEKGGANPVFGTAKEVTFVYAFAQRIYEKTRTWPFIYMSASVTRRRDWSLVAEKCPLWVAQYPNYNLTGYKSNPWKDNKGLGAWDKYWNGEKIRQYSSCGSIAGYVQTQPHKLDLDIAYMTRDEWKKFATGANAKEDLPVTPKVISEVLENKYGTGAARSANLKAAGYNPTEIQKKINQLNDIAIKKLKPIKTEVGEYWNCLLDLL